MFRYTFQWRPAFAALPSMLSGAVVTMQIAILSMLIGMAIGIVLALGRRSENKALYGLATSWVELARNTPALFQIYMTYFGLGSFGIQLDSYLSLLVGISFNNAGYLAETFRGGLRAVPTTQSRAARSLGMSALQTFRLVVWPQLLRVTFYPITNQMVFAVLMTSLGVVVGLDTDLTGVTQELNVRTFRTFEFFTLAAAIYYLITKAITLSARLAAWRLFRY